MIKIIGKPIAKKRPRFARRGKFVMTYNDQETEEGKFFLQVQQQWKEPPLEGAVQLFCDFFMPIPKGTSKKKRAQMISGDIPHIKKPDLDNLAKFVKDCLNSLIWKDDSQVIMLYAIKHYGEEPMTMIDVKF